MGLFDTFKNLGTSSALKALENKGAEVQKIIEDSKLVLDSRSVLLKKGENLLYSRPANFLQERAIRQYHSGRAGIRIAKGVWVGGTQGRSESHGEMRVIDSGNLLLTNEKIVFNGALKNQTLFLKKVNHLQVYSDGIEIGVENRQKVLVFSSDFPHFLSYLIRQTVSPDTSNQEELNLAYKEITAKLFECLKLVSFKGKANSEIFEQYANITKKVSDGFEENLKQYIKDKVFYPRLVELSQAIKEYGNTCSEISKEIKEFDTEFPAKPQPSFDDWLNKRGSASIAERVGKGTVKIQAIVDEFIKQITKT